MIKKNSVAIMSEESMSIEETNKIRISLGLKPIPLPNQPQPTPTTTSSKNDDISVEETNRLRASLGLKPIVETTSAKPSREQSIEEYQELQQKEERDQKIRQKLEIAKSKAAKRKKINVARSLLEEEEENQETDDWLNKIRKPAEKSKVKKVKKIIKNDNGDDLSGLKVGHSIDDINNLQQEDVILTLKDRSILDDEDELESELLVKKNKLEKQIAEKLRTNKYKKYDGVEGEEKSLLERYDEELQGDNGDSFVLNGGTIKVDKPKEVEPVEKNGKRKMEFSIDDDDEDEPIETSDYAKAKPIKMKKLKKKSGNSRKREERTDEDGDLVALQSVELKDEDSSLQDDFELQSALALKRLKNLKKRKHIKPEDIAKEIEEDRENQMNVDSESQGIVIDENTEFLSSIKAGGVEESENGQPVETEEVIADVDGEEGDKMDVDVANEPEAQVEEEAPVPAEEEEVNFNGGIGSLLGFLKSKNIVETKTQEQIDSEKRAKELKKKLDLEKLKTEIEKRIYEESLHEDSSFQKLPKQKKEEILESELAQFKELQNPSEIADKLKNYKPEVKLKYIDEYGREMNTKEAYKALSHQFHGKGPSKSKVAKKLKKVEEERKQQYKENSILGGTGNAGEDDGNAQDKVGVRLQ